MESRKALMRKITFTKTGGRLVNLSGMIPNDWVYADAYLVKSDENAIIVEFNVIRRTINDIKHSKRIPRTTKNIKPTI